MPFIDGDSSTTPAKHADAKNHLSFPVMPNMQRRVCQSSDPLPIHPTSSDRSLLVRHPCELPSTTYRSALVPNFFLLFAVAVRHLPVVVIVHASAGATGSSLFLQLSHFCRRSMTALKTHGSLKTTSVHGQPTGLPCTGGSYLTATCGPLHCVRSGSADADDLAVSVGFIPL